MTGRIRHFRWIALSLMPAAINAGWMPASNADDHHGQWSVLCEWLCDCPEAWPLQVAS